MQKIFFEELVDSSIFLITIWNKYMHEELNLSGWQ